MSADCLCCLQGYQPVVTGVYERQPITTNQLEQLKQLVESDRYDIRLVTPFSGASAVSTCNGGTLHYNQAGLIDLGSANWIVPPVCVRPVIASSPNRGQGADSAWQCSPNVLTMFQHWQQDKEVLWLSTWLHGILCNCDLALSTKALQACVHCHADTSSPH